MSSVYRKLLVVGAGAALLLGVTAGPLAAASKTYTVSVANGTFPYASGTVTGTVTFGYTNTTPSASINSLTLQPPSGGGYTITAVGPITESSGTAGNYTVLPSTLPTTQTISVTNLNPVGNGVTVYIPVTVTVDTSSVTSCSSAVGTWITQAYTGSNLGGNTFTLTSSAPTTSVGYVLQPGGSTSYTDANGNTVTVTNTGTLCTPLTLSRSANSTTILKPTIPSTSTSYVALKVVVVWDPEPAVSPLPWTQVDTPASANNTTTGTHDIEWCGGTNGQTPPGAEVSCLNNESTQLIAGTSTVQVTDVIYLLGDWTGSRTAG